MKTRNLVLGFLLAAAAALPFVGGFSVPSAAQSETKTGAVNYAPVPAGVYKLDPAHSLIGFGVRHFEINVVEGRFKDFAGTINFDDRDVTKSTVEFTAKTASVDTEIAPRDEHLRSADFFDVANYPEMSFKSTKITKKGKNAYLVEGDFTLRGVTKRIEFPFMYTGAVVDPWGNTRFGVEAQTKINRRDYGVNYGKALAIGGFDVANEVAIDLKLEAFKPGEKPAAAAK